ncbi:hypothetical protein N7G274_002113 [Stereocaulon virgatum]|uniref:Uncharacterized protein n=1 Tax=Stereocaulon virgatum TaxID=373712 RepID=A0ABR4AQG3_9LECA
MASETVKHFGNIDILIPCAEMLLMRDLEHTTEEDFDSMMRHNVKQAVPHMAPSSHIVLFSTNLCIASTVTPPCLLYNAIKGAIEQMTRIMSKDLAARRICVNCVAPEPAGMDLFYNGKSEQLLKMIAGFSPTG